MDKITSCDIWKSPFWTPFLLLVILYAHVNWEKFLHFALATNSVHINLGKL